MSKSSGLAVLALLIAIGALGLGVYQIFFVTEAEDEESGIKNTWYKFEYASKDTNPVSTIITIDTLTINFTVSSGESVYFHFSTWATVQGSGNSFIRFNFVLDGVILAGPQYPWWSIRTMGDRIEAPVSFQLSLDTATAGAHNVTISIVGSDINNNIFSSTLMVQTYVP